ncbi:ABC transporter permease [Halobacterium wangiae]|uniref:ABC transporter permease n=1 Tax=Halobacterium wangiae TaxID=2902623 RepID=UPI001E2D969D|nr:ABC transporter permease [Halobacterium wangiae]
MSYPRLIIRRVGLSLVSAYLVVSATFFLVNLMVYKRLDGILASARYGGAGPEEIARIRQGFVEARGLDNPLHERYINWIVDVTTLDWGYSRAYEKPVIDVLNGRVQTTLEYVIPGVAIAILLGVTLGLIAALSRDRPLDWSSRVGSYVLLGIPAFMTIYYLEFLAGTTLVAVEGVIIVFPVLDTQTIATLAVAFGLLAGQVRFARSAVLDEVGKDFVKLLRAKGSPRLNMARHLLRNAAIPIVSLSVAEILGVLMLNIYIVESVLGISGLAEASLRAVRLPDIRLAIWTTMVLVFIGIAGNLIQDILYGYLDPRIQSD